MIHTQPLRALLFMAIAVPAICVAQMGYYLSPDFGSRFNDINDNGVAISGGAYFDFGTQTWTPMEAEATEMVSINNNGDVAGSMFLDEELFILQPAYKRNGTWSPIGWFPASNPQESSFSTFSISPNGVWVTGQMSIGCCDFGTFKYNTETQVLTEIFSQDYLAVAGYVITDDGTIGGWADDEGLNGGTRRIPVIITPDLEIIVITPTLPTLSVNAVNDINASSVMVGDFDNQPFIYDQNTDEFTTFNIPFGYIAATFTSISNTGVAVGYAQNFGEFGSLVREAIVYHPSLGAQPRLLKDILLINGIDINAPSGRMGTAIAISPNGEYITGWNDTSPFFASGWIVFLNELLFEEQACTMSCPADITIVSEQGQTSAVVEYDVPFTCVSGGPDDAELVLISGLPSGSTFAFGTYQIVHHLVDGDGNVLDICTFNIVVSDTYCPPQIQFFVEPITRMVLAGVDHSSTEDPSAPAHEFFLDVEVTMNAGASYPISLEGYTGGEYINHFTVFVDFDQDGEFNTTSEMFEIGSIENSTGLDGQAATGTIVVPTDAALGVTRMRIIKSASGSPVEPCWSYEFGQVEDYTVNIADIGTGTFENTRLAFTAFPNPATEQLRITATDEIDMVVLFNVHGQEVLRQTVLGRTGVIDIAALSNGVYTLRAIGKDASHVISVVKQ
ncbi:MAG: T9SS type A sorting domain-containing protein [Flavobacteriales bacterium]|nr:T9SS type A sorting domain-containing protein [Flavobacteriales bacterium]